MLANDIRTVRQILKAACDSAAREKRSFINADEVIADLGRFYPYGLPFDQDVLRKEVAQIARRYGLATAMGDR